MRIEGNCQHLLCWLARFIDGLVGHFCGVSAVLRGWPDFVHEQQDNILLSTHAHIDMVTMFFFIYETSMAFATPLFHSEESPCDSVASVFQMNDNMENTNPADC